MSVLGKKCHSSVRGLAAICLSNAVTMEGQFRLPARSRSQQRRDLGPAVTQARQGGALRAVQSRVAGYVRVSACRRCPVSGGGVTACWFPFYLAAQQIPLSRVLKRLPWLRGILCQCDLRLPRQLWSG